MEPVWTSPGLKEFFEENVLTPWKHPEYYEPRLAPLPWCVSVFGRTGVHKHKAIAELCQAHEIPYVSVSVTLGHTQDAVNMMDCCLIEAAKEQPRQDGGPIVILIVDHMDILLYEADGEAVMLKALSLDKFSKHGVFIIGLFDRTSNDPDLVQRPTKPWEKECQIKFYQQFRQMGFAAAPHATFRASYFEWAISAFVKHLHACGRHMTLDLTEGDYTSLADYSTFATPKNILEWLQVVFYAIIQAPGEESFNMDIFKRFLTNKSGAPHICEFDTRLHEDRYSLFCGKGPILKPKFTPPKVVTDQLNVNVTSFAPSTAGIQEADEALQAQRKRQRESQPE